MTFPAPSSAAGFAAVPLFAVDGNTKKKREKQVPADGAAVSLRVVLLVVVCDNRTNNDATVCQNTHLLWVEWNMTRPRLLALCVTLLHRCPHGWSTPVDDVHCLPGPDCKTGNVSDQPISRSADQEEGLLHHSCSDRNLRNPTWHWLINHILHFISFRFFPFSTPLMMLHTDSAAMQ